MHRSRIAVLLGILALLASATDATSEAAKPLFATAFNYPIASANLVAVGDFNGDGVMDLAMVSSGANPGSLEISLGKAGGGFKQSISYPVNGVTDWVGVGDFNRDGKLDVVVVVSGPGNAAVFMGNGDGTFQAEVDYSAGSFPVWAAVADLNGDGILDLAVANVVGFMNNFGANDPGDGYVSVLLGNADGTLQPPINYAAGRGPLYIASADFNKDGSVDLVVSCSRSNTVNMLLNNGDGTFLAPITLIHGVNDPLVDFVAVGDVNKDGNADIFVSQPGKLLILELLGNGDGTFQRKSVSTVEEPGYIAFGDFDNDGNIDLAATEAVGQSYIGVFLGDGTGKYLAPLNFTTSPFGGLIAVADVNQDDKPDILDANQEGVEVLLNQAAPYVTLSTEFLAFGTQLDGTTSATKNVTLTNTGYAQLNFSSVTASADFKARNGCGTILPEGASCNIGVAFAPTGPGSKIGTVSIADDASRIPQIINVIGQGTAFQLSPASIDFGDQAVGTTSNPQTVTLSAVGNGSMAVQIMVSGDRFDFSKTDNCGTSIAGGSSCTITLTFKPLGHGTVSATLEVIGGGGSPRLTTLSGNGT